MKKHILNQYKTKNTLKEKKDTTTQTFEVENSDRDNFVYKRESTKLTENVETSD